MDIFFGKYENYFVPRFSVGHIVFLILTIGVTFLLALLLRKVNHKKIATTLKVFACIMLYSDCIKWIWDLIKFGTINPATSLPMYLCSLIIFILPFAAFGKGKVKQASLAYLATLNILAGVMGLVFNTVITMYPPYHFVVVNSFTYHGIMLFIGFWLWLSRYYKPEIKDIGLFYIPFIAIALPVLGFDLAFGWDYMFFNGGINTPFNILAKLVPSWLYIIILFIGYYAITVLLFYIPTIIKYIKNKRTSINDNSNTRPLITIK